MQVFIDTNIIMKANYFRSEFAKLFLKAAHLLEIKIIIPDVVIDEVIGNYEKDLKEKVKSFSKSHRELSVLTDDLDEFEDNTEYWLSEYEDFISEIIEDAAIDIPPYPKTTTQQLVRAEYSQEKPYKPNGDGHKDYLIWKTICAYELESGEDAKVYFLTNNPKDFCEGNELHPDLASQITEPTSIPKIALNLDVFFKEQISPQLEGCKYEDIDGLTPDRIDSEVNRLLLDMLPHYSAYGFAGVPFQNEVMIDMVGEAEEVQRAFKKVDDDEVLITVEGTVDIYVDGYIDKHDFYTLDEETAQYVSVSDGNHNHNHNDHVMTVSTEIDTPFEMTLTYSKNDDEIKFVKVILPDEIEDDFYK